MLSKIRPNGWILSTVFGLGLIASSAHLSPSVATYLMQHRAPAAHATLDRAVITASHFIARHYRIPAPRARRITKVAFQVSRKHRVDPYLVLAVIAVESSFRPYVVNRRGGAYGLMQIVPRVHRKRVEAEGGLKRLSLILPNIRIGVLILVEYGVRSRERLRHALWRYSGGEEGYARRVLQVREALANVARASEFDTAG